MAAIKKMQKGGSTTKKKVDNSITGKIQRGMDYMLGSDKLRAAGVAANNALKPYADKTRTAMNKTLTPSKSKSSMAKMQKGGSTTSKKVDNSITGKMQRGLDYMLGSDKLRAKGVAANKAIKPYADKTRTAMNKALRPVNPKPLMAKKMQSGGMTKKMGDGGGTKVTRGDIKDAQREAKLKRIQAGTEPSTYDKVSKITGDVANVASTVGQGIKAVQNAKSGSNDRPGFQKGGSMRPIPGQKDTTNAPTDYSKMGKGYISTKGSSDQLRNRISATRKVSKGKLPANKFQKGGGIASGVNDIVTGSKKIGNSVARNVKPIAKTAAAIANPIGTGIYKGVGMAGKSADDMLQKRYPNYTGKGTAYSKAKSVAKTVLGYKKGGSKKK
jgi:alpha-D-ribose 1-methylphosphonate 5-triphosphate synthase subunit PhnG